MFPAECLFARSFNRELNSLINDSQQFIKKKKVHNVVKTNFAEARNASETHAYFNNPLRV